MTTDLDELLTLLRKHGVHTFEDQHIKVILGPQPISIADIVEQMKAEGTPEVVQANPVIARENVNLEDALWGCK